MPAILVKVLGRADHPLPGAHVQFFLGQTPIGRCVTGTTGTCHVDVDGPAASITAQATADGFALRETIDPAAGSFTFRFPEVDAPMLDRDSFLERHWPGLVGIVFLLLTIALAFTTTDASPLQDRIIRGTFALAGAAFAAEITGLLTVNLTLGKQLTAQGTGAFAVFLLIWFFAPA
jgi:hypothetical protein